MQNGLITFGFKKKQRYPCTAVNINYIYKWDVATVGQAPAENQMVAKETEDVVQVDATA